MVISADRRAETGTQNSKRLDRRSMFPFCTCSHQSEHINTPCRLTLNTDASDQKCKLTQKKINKTYQTPFKHFINQT